MTDDVHLLLDPAWTPRSGDDEEGPPADAVVGSWSVRHGSPGPLRPNPAYVPGHESSPTDAVDAVVRLLRHGDAADEHLAPLLHDAVVEVATDGGVHPVHVRSPDGPRCQVVVTSRTHRERTRLPAWRRVGLTGLLRSLPDGVDLLVNPGGPTPARWDGGALRRTPTGSASAALPDADERRAGVAAGAVPGPRHLPGYLVRGGGIGDAHVRSWGDVLQRLVAQARAVWPSLAEYRPLPADPAPDAAGEPGAARDLEAWLSAASISARWDGAVGPSGIGRSFVRRGGRRDTVVTVNLRVTLLDAADTGPVPDRARGTGDGAGSGLRVVEGTVGLRLTVTRHDTSARRHRAPGRRGLRVPSVGVTVADPSPVLGELVLHVRGDDMRSAPAAPWPDAAVVPGPVDPVHPAAPGIESAVLPGTTVLFVGGSEAVERAASEAVDEVLGHDRVPGAPGVVRWRSLSDALGADRLRGDRDVFGAGIVVDDLVCGSRVFERIGEVTATMSVHRPRLVSDGGTAASAPDRDAWPPGLRTCVVQADARATVTFTGGRAADTVDGVPSGGGRSSTRHVDLPGRVFLRVDRVQARAWGLLPGPPGLPVTEPPGGTDEDRADPPAAGSAAAPDGPSTPAAEGGHAADGGLDGLSPHRPDDPAAAAVGIGDRVLESDPVDVVTGEVVLEQVDLRPAGPDGVVLGRTYVSTYRAGRLFGPRWASTLDQRLEVDARGVCYVADDGRVLVYPPTVDASLPVAGPRWPLRVVAGGYELHRDGDEVLRFARRGGDAGVHPLVEVRDRTGAVTAVEHDAGGVPVAVAVAGGRRFELGHDDGRLAEVRAAGAGPGGPAVVLSFGYDAGGRLTQVVDPSGLPVVLQYDDEDRLVGWQDRGGHWYRYVHDEQGRCVRTVGEGGYGDGAFGYDAGRRTTTYRDALGATSVYEHDGRGRVVRRTDPLGHVTRSVWDRDGRLLARTDPLGRTMRHEYSGDARRPARTVGPDGRVVGPVAADRPPAAAAPDEVRSPQGRLVARGAQRWVHDGDGNVVEHVDAAGRVTRHEYGVFGIRTATTDPAGVRTVFGHDRELRLVSVTTSRGLQWRYSYDAAGRMSAQTDFDGRVTRFEHDAAGQLVAVVDAAGGRTELGYDVRGMLVSRRTAEGVTVFVHDEHGRLVSASAPGSSVHVERDGAGRVVAQTVDGRTVAFSYRDDERTVWRRTPSGATSAWRFAPDGSAVSLASAWHVLDLDRDAAGRRTGLRVDGTTVLRQHRDGDGALAAVEVGRGAGVLRREFVRHRDGRPSAVRDGTGETRFALDPVGRVSSVVGPGRAESYRYDDLGAVSSSVVAADGTGGRPQTREVRGTTLLRCGGTRFEHDVLGRVTARVERAADGSPRRWDHEWDSLGQLVGIRTPDGRRWRYRYDPLGRRTSKELLDDAGRSLGTVRFAWDGTALVEAEELGPGPASHVTTWNHEPADGSPVAQVEAWFAGTRHGGPHAHRLRVVVTDAVGTPVLLADPGGAVTWHATGTLWGAPVRGRAAGRGGEGTPLRFPGQYLDEESGLHHNVYRYYDPTTARYLSPDPLGLEPAPHPVAYVGNPLHELDPLGLAGVCGPGSAVDVHARGGLRTPGGGWTARAAAGTASSGYAPAVDGGSGR